MINTVTLERMTFATQTYVSREIAADFGNAPDVRVMEYAARGLVMELRQHIYGEQLDQRTIRYPETWRDAVKGRLYAWLRSGHWPYGADLMERRWPVVWHETTFDVTALYPKISMPHERHSIRVAQLHDTSIESQRLWFDAQNSGLNNVVYELMYHGRAGRTWHAGHAAYRALMDIRSGMGEYLFVPPLQVNVDPTLIGMPVKRDPSVPLDTLELRDKDDRIVGKVYNIR